jgi:hypothetical protein
MNFKNYKLRELLATRKIYIDLLIDFPLSSQVIIREHLTAIEQLLSNYTKDEELIYTSQDIYKINPKLEYVNKAILTTELLN